MFDQSVIVNVFLIFCGLQFVTTCPVHLCFTEYTNLAKGYHKMQKVSTQQDYNSQEANRNEYCKHLESYYHCMMGLNRSCRGKLDYHAVISHVRKWLEDYSCNGTQKFRQDGSKSSISLRQQIEARRQELLQQQQRQSDHPSSDEDEVNRHEHHWPSDHKQHPREGRRHRKCKNHRPEFLPSNKSPGSNLLPIFVILLPSFVIRIIIT